MTNITIQKRISRFFLHLKGCLPVYYTRLFGFILLQHLYLGVTMLVFYKNWQGIGESPVRNEFHREASAERWNGHSWQGIRRYPVSFCKTLT